MKRLNEVPYELTPATPQPPAVAHRDARCHGDSAAAMVGAVTPGAAPMAEPTEPRAVVAWAGPGQPIKLTLYGPAGEVAVLLTPTRALELAKDLTDPAVTAIKTSQWGPGWPG